MTAGGTTTNYTQDLAADQSQILAGTVGMTTTDYLYGQDTAPLAALSGGTRTWYGIDGQGSVRQSLDDSGNILGVQNYDPFGQIEAGSSLLGPFGYTGELQDSVTGQEYLRARWYQPGSGHMWAWTLTSRPLGSRTATPSDDPVNGGDPLGLATVADEGSSEDDLPTAEDINKALQNVLDTFPDVVEPDPQEAPGDQPYNLFIGTEVHKYIVDRYRNLNPRATTYGDTTPIGTIFLEHPELGAGVDELTDTERKKSPTSSTPCEQSNLRDQASVTR